MDGKHRVEQMRETDTMRLRNQAEQMPVAVEAPRATEFHYFEPRFVVAIEQFIGDTARCSLVSQLQRLGSKPLYAHHRNDLVR